MSQQIVFFFRYFREIPTEIPTFPHIEKEDTKFRKAISASERLAITLRLFATGDSQQTLSFSFRVGKATVSKIVAETSDAIYSVLKETYLSSPKTKEDWLRISQEFEDKWNMPHTVGCIDAKYVRIECPKLSGLYIIIIRGFTA